MVAENTRKSLPAIGPRLSHVVVRWSTTSYDGRTTDYDIVGRSDRRVIYDVDHRGQSF